MARRRPRRTPVPPPLPDELCSRLSFEPPNRDAWRLLITRDQAARQHRTTLTAAERAAVKRLEHAVIVSLQIDELLVRQHRQPIASRALYAADGEVVVAVLWRTDNVNRQRGPYTVQLARNVGGHLTLLSVADGLRVDHAWPLYHAQTWPPAS